MSAPQHVHGIEVPDLLPGFADTGLTCITRHVGIGRINTLSLGTTSIKQPLPLFYLPDHTVILPESTSLA